MWAAWVRGWALGGWGSWLGAASRVRMQDKRQRGRASKELDASTGCINWMHQLGARISGVRRLGRTVLEPRSVLAHLRRKVKVDSKDSGQEAAIAVHPQRK